MKTSTYFFCSVLLLHFFSSCDFSTVTEQEPSPPPSSSTTVPEPPIVAAIPTDDWKPSSAAFIQEGQRILKEVEGDLNNDGVPDKVVVIENPASTAKADDLSAAYLDDSTSQPAGAIPFVGKK